MPPACDELYVQRIRGRGRTEGANGPEVKRCSVAEQSLLTRTGMVCHYRRELDFQRAEVHRLGEM